MKLKRFLVLSGVLPFLLTACPKDTHFPGKVEKNESDIAIWNGNNIVDTNDNILASVFDGTYVENGEIKRFNSYNWEKSFIMDGEYFGVIKTDKGYYVAKVDKENLKTTDFYSIDGEDIRINKTDRSVLSNKCCVDPFTGEKIEFSDIEDGNTLYRSKKYTISLPWGSQEIKVYENTTGKEIATVPDIKASTSRWFSTSDNLSFFEIGDTLFLRNYIYRNGEIKKNEKECYYFGCDNLFYVPNSNGLIDVCEMDENLDIVSTLYTVRGGRTFYHIEEYLKTWSDIEFMGEEAIANVGIDGFEIVYLKNSKKFIEIAGMQPSLQNDSEVAVTLYEDEKYRANVYFTRYEFDKKFVNRSCLLIKDKDTDVETNVKEIRDEYTTKNRCGGVTIVYYPRSNFAELVNDFLGETTFGVIRTGNIINL